MLYYDRIDFSEGIDLNQANESKERNICHYWHFLNKGFKFQLYVCNRCHDLLMMSMNLNRISSFFRIKNDGYHCIISETSKSEAINLLQNVDLTEKKWNMIKIKYQKQHLKL